MTEHALETTLLVADEVLVTLAEHGARAVIIGALALASSTSEPQVPT